MLFPSSIPKNMNKYFFNRVKDIELLNSYFSLLEKDISTQILVTGYRGVGKTFLLKKVLNDQENHFLTTYIDLSKIYAKEKGKLTEEEILKNIS